MVHQPRRGQIWRIAEPEGRRVVVYSGDMFNELTEVPHVITMEISNQSDYLDLELPDGQRIWYTRVDHVPKIYFAEQVGEVSAELMSTVNTRLFMVIATN